MNCQNPIRKIIHIDMDAFYASIEQRDRPNLKGKPIVVGGDPHSRGVVASASYEARKYGIRSAMSCSQAHRLCPQTIFIYPNFEKYVEANRLIMQILHSVTSIIEPLALDEAYLDVTTNLLNEPIARNIAIYLKEKIYSVLGISASAGIGPNKFIAKLASEFNKPDGLVVIAPEKAFQFIENLPVEKFWGVGPATAKKLHSIGIRSAADIRKRSVAELENFIGSYGRFLFELAHGEDNREVDSSFDPKSRGTEITFEKDVSNSNQLLEVLKAQAEEVSADLKSLGRLGRTITLKIKYSDFTLITRSCTLAFPTDKEKIVFDVASELLFRDTEVTGRAVRLIGLSVGNLVSPEGPLQLWFEF